MTNNCEALLTELIALCGKWSFKQEREIAGIYISTALMDVENPGDPILVLQRAVQLAKAHDRYRH